MKKCLIPECVTLCSVSSNLIGPNRVKLTGPDRLLIGIKKGLASHFSKWNYSIKTRNVVRVYYGMEADTLSTEELFVKLLINNSQLDILGVDVFLLAVSIDTDFQWQ